MTDFEPRSTSLEIDGVEITGWSGGEYCAAWSAAGIDRRTGRLSSLLVSQVEFRTGWGWAWEALSGGDYWIGGHDRDLGLEDYPPLTLEQAMLEAEDAVLSRYDYAGEWQRPGLPEGEIARRKACEVAAFEDFHRRLAPRRVFPESVIDLEEIRGRFR